MIWREAREMLSQIPAGRHKIKLLQKQGKTLIVKIIPPAIDVMYKAHIANFAGLHLRLDLLSWITSLRSAMLASNIITQINMQLNGVSAELLRSPLLGDEKIQKPDKNEWPK